MNPSPPPPPWLARTLRTPRQSRTLRRRLDAATSGAPFLIVLGSLLALLLVTVAIFVAVFPVHLSRGVGNETYVPASAADLHRSYNLGVGDLFLDLRNVRLPVGETKLTTRVDVGGLRVIVPPGAAVRVKADVRLGYLNLFGEANDGRNVDDAVTERGARVLVLDAHVAPGHCG